MRLNQQVGVDGSICAVYEYQDRKDAEAFLLARGKVGRKPICALTGKSIKGGEAFYLLFSNFELFPNCLVKQTPFNHLPSRTAIRQIAASWQEAQIALQNVLDNLAAFGYTLRSRA